tara:strand:+ start:34187 stop:34384 length:198 start_codon:yes stop_codon:yes gene_type:complete
MYSFDRTSSESFKAEERNNDLVYWSKVDINERLRAANYLISVAYDFDLQNPPSMDKSIFESRKRD